MANVAWEVLLTVGPRPTTPVRKVNCFRSNDMDRCVTTLANVLPLQTSNFGKHAIPRGSVNRAMHELFCAIE